jgi:hypothetical protein
MQSNIPQSIETRDGSYRCVRLTDGRFHLLKPGPLAHLFIGGDHILVSEKFAEVLRETCAHCLDLRRTELVQLATGEIFGIYYEVIPHDEVTPEDVDRVRASGFHVWHFGRANLFVSAAVVEQMQQRGIDGISFSPGFSRFAGAAA